MRSGMHRPIIGSWVVRIALGVLTPAVLAACGDDPPPNPPPHAGGNGGHSGALGGRHAGGAAGVPRAGGGGDAASSGMDATGGMNSSGAAGSAGMDATGAGGAGTDGGASSMSVGGDASSVGGSEGMLAGAGGEAEDGGQGGAGAPGSELGGTSNGVGGATSGGTGAGGTSAGTPGGIGGTPGGIGGSTVAGAGGGSIGGAGGATAGAAGFATAGTGTAGIGMGGSGNGGAGPGTACIRVAPDGNDTAAAASGSVTPFASVQAAIDYADTHRAGATNVCLAEGATCGTNATYAGPAGDLTMRDGISVYGNYESSGWTHCTTGSTTLAPGSAAGVYFSASVERPTTLDGVAITHFSAPETAAITLDGARGVTLSNLLIFPPESATTVVGIDASAGAVAALDTINVSTDSPDGRVLTAANQLGYRAIGAVLGITRSHVFLNTDSTGGPASAVGTWFEDAAGSSFTSSTVQILGYATQIVGLHIEASDGVVLDGTRVSFNMEDVFQATGAEILNSQHVAWSGGTVFVRGGGVTTNGLLLDTSPAAALDLSIKLERGPLVGVQIRGAADGTTIAGSVELTTAGKGVDINGCAGGTVTLNESVKAQALGIGSWDGIHVAGDCNANITTDLTLTDTGIPFETQTLSGIRCEGASRCTIHDSNISIANTATNSAIGVVDAEGIRCDSGSCPTIERNTVLSLDKPGVEHRDSSYVGGGISAPGSTLVSANWIDARCTGSNGTGLVASGRIENNRILGPSCGGRALGPNTAVGLSAVGAADVHSNTIVSNGALDGTSVLPPFNEPSCRSTAVVPNGANLRNNILLANTCTPSVAIQGPAYFLENNFVSAPFYLYASGDLNSGTVFTSIDQLNTLPFASDNISSGTTVDTGTTVGAPTTDRLGNVRDAHPDIGDLESTECSVDNGGCDPHVTCTKLSAGVVCGPCPAGYSGSGTAGCVDLDECALGTANCMANSVCTNTAGGFTCTCAPGYSAAGQQCVDIDECAQGICGTAGCVPTPGSYHCSGCAAGYQPSGNGCVDIDECAANHGGCDALVTCTNSAGSYACGACPSGYSGSGQSGCADIDECATDHGGCDPQATCTNTPGGRTCGACPAGFNGSGDTQCTDINECTTNNGGCDALTTCTNTAGGYVCSACPPGCGGTGAGGCVPAAPATEPFVQVTTGDRFACGLRRLGRLECWGSSDAYYGSQAPICDTYTQVSAGSGHVCAVRTDGTLQCWGGLTGETPSGVFSAVSAGGLQDCGLHPDGTIACWGSDFSGSTEPPAGSFLELAVASVHACALRTDHTVACWGDDTFGEASPPGGTFLGISAHGSQSCGVHDDGAVECWGREDLAGWEAPPSGSFVAVAAGDYEVCAQNADRTLTCWSDPGYAGTPPAIPFSSFSLGWISGCGVGDDGVVSCWGDDRYGQSTPPL